MLGLHVKLGQKSWFGCIASTLICVFLLFCLEEEDIEVDDAEEEEGKESEYSE